MNEAKKTAGRPKPSLSILVADDSQDTVTMLSVILRDEGHTVHEVTHGGFVLEAVRRFRPQICILDIQMPGKNGYDIARDINAEFKKDAPLLIAISGKWTTKADRYVAQAVGFQHFLVKPADPDDLLEILDDFSPREQAA